MVRRSPHRELRNNSSAVLRAVQAGETNEVTNHGTVVAVLVPPASGGSADVAVAGDTTWWVRRPAPNAARPAGAGGSRRPPRRAVILAAALRLRANVLLTYDHRQADAARQAGIRVEAPR